MTTRIELVDSGAREDFQRYKFPDADNERIAASHVDHFAEHLLLARQAGIRRFDSLSVVNPNAVPASALAEDCYREAMIRFADAGMDFDIKSQALLMSAREKYAERVSQLFVKGTIQSLAYVHSTDPDFLFRSYRLVDERAAVRDSRSALAGISAIGQDVDQSLITNVYLSRSTGRVEQDGSITIFEPETIADEIKKIAPYYTGHPIICDSESIAEPETTQALMEAVVARNIPELGIHFHVSASTGPQKAHEVLVAAVKPTLGKTETVSIEFGGTSGGCVDLPFSTGNMSLSTIVEGLRELQSLGYEFDIDWPDMGKYTSVAANLRRWHQALQSSGATLPTRKIA